MPLSPRVASATMADAAATLPSHKRYNGLIWLVAASFFMQALDSTIVNTAVPSVATALQQTPLNMRSALTCYVLTLAVLIPAAPWLCDRFGTRRVFGAAIGVFALGSLPCGLSQTMEELVMARVLQGVGGAALMPVGRYVLARYVDKWEFVQVMSTALMFGLIGSVLGPLLGGALVAYASWRWIFLINVPIGIVGIWLNAREMPEYRLDMAPRFDLAGFLLFGVSSVLLLAACELATEKTVHWGPMGLLAGLAVAFSAAYVRHSRRTPQPIADLGLLRIRSVWVSLSGNLLTRLGVSGMFLLIVLFFQMGCGWSPLAAGLMMVPQALGAICFKQLVNRALIRLGYRRLLFGNTLVVAVLLAMFALLGPHTPMALIALLIFVYGGFMSMQYTAINTLIYKDLKAEDTAMASSMASIMQYLSMSFGIALAAVLMQTLLHGQDRAAYMTAFRWTVIVLAALTAIASRIFARLDEVPRYSMEPARSDQTTKVREKS